MKEIPPPRGLSPGDLPGIMPHTLCFKSCGSFLSWDMQVSGWKNP